MRERSIGEVADDVDRLRHDMDRRMTDMATRHTQLAAKVDAAPYVRVDLHTEQITNLRGDVASLRQVTMWLLGLLVSAIVGAIVVLVITAGRGAAI
jgi:hypothetical protein